MGKKKNIGPDEATVAAAKAMADKTPGERETLIVKRFNDWEESKTRQTSERTETKADVDRARSNLKEIMEQGHIDGDQEASLQKLHNIEIAWQDVEECVAAQKDRYGSAKDHVKYCFDLLQEAIRGVNQLGLFGHEVSTNDIFPD